MNTKYIEKLEFNKILHILSENCITNNGKTLSNNLQPCNKKEIVLSLLKETSEAVNLINRKQAPLFADIVDFTYISKILENNGVLSPKCLLDVLRNFKTCYKFKNLLL